MSAVPINCWAIVVSMVASVVLGMVWYGPLFGKKWMELSGIPMPSTRPPMSMMVKPMIIALVGAFFMAQGLTNSLAFGEAYLHIYGYAGAFQGAFWTWLSFMVPLLLTPVAWEKKPWKLFFIHAGYWLVLLAVMALIIGVWM